MTTSMYCLYVGFDYTYIDVNALCKYPCMYVCICICGCICICTCMYVHKYPCMCVCVHKSTVDL